jgi:hypothetical protein
MKTLALTSSALMMAGILVVSAPAAYAKGNKKANPKQTTTSLSCTAGSVTANPLAGGSPVAYSACLDPISDNDVTSSINGDLTSFLDTYLGDWALDAKYEGNAVTAGENKLGFSWVSNEEGEDTWSVDNAITTPFVISLKTSKAFAAYYVDGVNSTLGGAWATFNEKDLSHASLFVARQDEPVDTSVPEPTTTVALTLLGLTAVGIKKKLG